MSWLGDFFGSSPSQQPGNPSGESDADQRMREHDQAVAQLRADRKLRQVLASQEAERASAPFDPPAPTRTDQFSFGVPGAVDWVGNYVRDNPFGSAASPAPNPDALGLAIPRLSSPASTNYPSTTLGHEDRAGSSWVGDYARSNPFPTFSPESPGASHVTSGRMSGTSPKGIQFDIPTVPDFPTDLRPVLTRYHGYNVPVDAGNISPSDLMSRVINRPTPGSPHPASPGGTLNDAMPSLWSNFFNAMEIAAYDKVIPGEYSPVRSYATTDQNGNPIVVNVTLKGHPLYPGYVVRHATTGPDGHTILNNEGVGAGRLQSSSSPRGVRNFINNQWVGQSRDIIRERR